MVDRPTGTNWSASSPSGRALRGDVLVVLLSLAILAAVLVLWRYKKNGQQRVATPGNTRAAPAAPVTPRSSLIVEETVSVVLRRQIPVRFDEAPRSWLGGLPMMPADVRWPTAATTDHPEQGSTPLHFVAQVACSDLPRELWGGLGPRTGWLLLFLNGEDWDVMDNPEALQVIHITELGSERQPPQGILPVHDEMYTGPDYGFVRTQAEVPTVWRRWPVDLVTVPNSPVTRGGSLTIIPENFASKLYENASVADERGQPVVPQVAPFSWRGALYVVDSIVRALSSGKFPELRETDREKLNSPEWVAQTGAAIDKRITDDEAALKQWDARELNLGDAKGLAQRDWANKSLSERIQNLTMTRDFLNRGDLWLRMTESLNDFRQWRVAGLARVAGMREHILSHELDTPLGAPEWETIRSALDSDRCTYWVLGYRDIREAAPMRVETSLLTLGAKGLDASRIQLAADYYSASPERRSMVPQSLIDALEPYWRRLYDNRPHRMGGVHDAIQSDPRVGPRADVLLFQIVSDNAMHWTWGDAGAYYVFIGTDQLAKHDFTRLQAFFENH